MDTVKHRKHMNQTETKTIALRVPVDEIAFLRDQAKANERTVSGEIRRLIREYRQTVEGQEAA